MAAVLMVYSNVFGGESRRVGPMLSDRFHFVTGADGSRHLYVHTDSCVVAARLVPTLPLHHARYLAKDSATTTPSHKINVASHHLYAYADPCSRLQIGERHEVPLSELGVEQRRLRA